MKLSIFILILITFFSSCRNRDEKKPIEANKSDPKNNFTPVDTNTPTGNQIDFSIDFTKGSESADVIIEYYADLACGACAAMSSVLDNLLTKYEGKLSLVFKNYPKDKNCMPAELLANVKPEWIKETSCMASAAARCVGLLNNRFWEFKDFLFANRNNYSATNFRIWALNFGLMANDYDICIRDKRISDKIASDIQEAKDLGVTGTPTIYINGIKIYPANPTNVEQEIIRQLN